MKTQEETIERYERLLIETKANAKYIEAFLDKLKKKQRRERLWSVTKKVKG